MLTAEIRSRSSGEETILGKLQWNGRNFALEGDHATLHNILTSPIVVAFDDLPPRRYSVQDDPEGFVRGLERYYKNPYLYAVLVEDAVTEQDNAG